MKKALLIILVLSLLIGPFVCNAQVASNQAYTLIFNGYSNGYYLVTVTVKLNCSPDLRLSWSRGGLPSDTSIKLAASETRTLRLPSNVYVVGEQIKIKSDAPCSSSGWLSINTVAGTALPITVVSFKAVRQKNGVQLSYKIQYEDQADFAFIEYATDGLKWQTLHFIGDQKEQNFFDLQSASQRIYYRLRVVSPSGNEYYSRVLMVAPGIDLNSDRRMIYNFQAQLLKVLKPNEPIPKGSYVIVNSKILFIQ